MTLDKLVLLNADEAGHQGGGGGDGGYDASRDQLGLVAVGGRDRIVLRPQVGRGHDEVHVEVRVVVLLEVGRQDLALARDVRPLGQALDDADDLVLVGGLGLRHALRLGVVDGDLHPLPGLEGLHLDPGHDAADHLAVAAALDPVDGGQHVGGGDDEVHVHLGGRVEVEGLGAALGARPEQGPRGGGLVGREVEEQLSNLVVKELLKEEARPVHTLLEVGRPLVHQDFLDLLQGLDRLLALELESLVDEVGLAEVLQRRHGCLREGALEAVASPLKRVFDLVGEVLQGADRDGLLGRVLGRAV